MWDPNPDLIEEPDPGTVEAARTPLLLIHDGGGTTYSYYCLYPPLGRPVYGIANPHFHTGDRWAGGLSEMARHYVRLLRATLGTGNVILGGWSLGGMIALEMAHALAGDRWLRVVGIVMIDTPCPLVWRAAKNPGAVEVPRNGTSHRHASHNSNNHDDDDDDDDDISRDSKSGSNSDSGSATPEAAQLLFADTTRQEIKDKVMRSFAEAGAMVSSWTLPRWSDDNIKPRPPGGGGGAAAACSPPPPAILLRSQEPVPIKAQDMAGVDLARDDPRLGWDLYRPGLFCQVLDIPGHHFNVFAEQNLPEVRKALLEACKTLDYIS